MQADDVSRLILRLALLRQRIDQTFLAVAQLPIEGDDDDDDEFSDPLLVSESTHPSWKGEGVLLWHRRRGADAWAVQSRCPHASISLEMSDIEDFTGSFPSTRGPCIACPAHMYVFDLGSGACLTDSITPRARTYAVQRSGPHAMADGAQVFCLWLAREPRGEDDACASPAATPPDVVASVGNQIQLQLVSKGLRRRFGADEDEDDDGLGDPRSARVLGYDV